MLEQKRLSILENILGNYNSVHSKNGTEYVFFCLFCKHHKRKLSCNINKGFFKCWVCDQKGNIYSLIKKFGNNEQAATWRDLTGIIDHSDEFIPEIDKVELPKEFISLSKQNIFAKQALQYLFGRNISKDDILWWKMGFCCEGFLKNKIIIPSYNMNGDLDYFVGRSYDDHSQKYVYPKASKDLIFNELFLNWKKDIILTEGIFDAIIAENSIPLLGSTLTENSKIFQSIVSNVSKIYLGLDPDAKSKENNIIKLFLKYGMNVHKIEIKPWVDIGSMTKTEFQERKQNSIQLSHDNIIEYMLK